MEPMIADPQDVAVQIPPEKRQKGDRGHVFSGKRKSWPIVTGGVILITMTVLYSCTPSARKGRERNQTTITWMVGVDYTKDMLEQLIERFEELHPEIDIKPIWVPALQYYPKLKTLIAAGQPPDLFTCGDVWIAYQLPFLYDITDFVQRDQAEIDLEDIYPELREACRWNGRYYFLPRWFNISLLYYNESLFDAAGVAYPTADWTWEDYVEAGKALTQIGPDGRVNIWGSKITHLWWGEWLILVRQSGGRLFNEDLTECLLDTPEAMRGLQFYFDKVYRYGFAPPPGYGPDRGFASGKMAMDFGGHTGDWVTYNDISGLEWDIQILPRGPVTRRGGELAIDTIGLSESTRHPEEAWEFVKFMSSPESVRKHVRRGFLSIRKSVAEELLFNRAQEVNPRNVRAAYEALKYAQPIPRSPDYIELALEIIQPDIDRMLIEGIPPETTCRQVTRSANAFLETLGKGKNIP